MSRYSIFTP